MTTATLDRMTGNALIASAGISAAALLAGLAAPAGFLTTLALPALAIVAGRLSAGHFAGLRQNQCLATGAAVAVLPLEAMPAVAPLSAALFLFVGLFGARFIDGMVAASRRSGSRRSAAPSSSSFSAMSSPRPGSTPRP